VAPLRRGSAVTEYLIGIRLALRGARLTFSRLRLLGMVIVPLAINVALLVTLGKFMMDFAAGYAPNFDEPFVTGFDWLRVPLQSTLGFLLGLIGVLAALLSMLVCSTVINAPFHEWISEGVETIVLGKSDSRPLTAGHVWRVWIVPVLQAGVLAVVQSVLAIAFLIASFSGVLAPVATVGSVYLLALTLADVVIARKACPVSDRFKVVRNALPTWLGLATPLFFVPFLTPFFVAGATLVYLRGLKLARES
jgi:uncharacterized protein involved in cysteine biosynthesis